MWLYLFTIKNNLESVFFIVRDAYSCVYKTNAPKTSSTNFNKNSYCIIFKRKLPEIKYDIIKILGPFFCKTAAIKSTQYLKLLIKSPTKPFL